MRARPKHDITQHERLKNKHFLQRENRKRNFWSITSRLQFNLLDAYTGLDFGYQAISYKSELLFRCKIESLTSGLLHRACLWLTAAATREEIQESMYRGRKAVLRRALSRSLHSGDTAEMARHIVRPSLQNLLISYKSTTFSCSTHAHVFNPELRYWPRTERGRCQGSRGKRKLTVVAGSVSFVYSFTTKTIAVVSHERFETKSECSFSPELRYWPRTERGRCQ